MPFTTRPAISSPSSRSPRIANGTCTRPIIDACLPKSQPSTAGRGRPKTTSSVSAGRGFASLSHVLAIQSGDTIREGDQLSFVMGPQEPLVQTMAQAADRHAGGRVRVAVAWARDEGVWWFLRSLRNRIDSIGVIVGMNERGTTVEALLRLLDAGADVTCVFKHPSQTFHPKVYWYSGGTGRRGHAPSDRRFEQHALAVAYRRTSKQAWRTSSTTRRLRLSALTLPCRGSWHRPTRTR